jgi:hypothetical protein
VLRRLGVRVPILALWETLHYLLAWYLPWLHKEIHVGDFPFMAEGQTDALKQRITGARLLR